MGLEMRPKLIFYIHHHGLVTLWRNWLAHWTLRPEVAGSNPARVVSSKTIQNLISIALTMKIVGADGHDGHDYGGGL